MWASQKDKYATLGSVYELKKKRKRKFFISLFKSGGSKSVPNLGISTDTRNVVLTNSSKRSHSVCHEVGKVGDTALKILVRNKDINELQETFENNDQTLSFLPPIIVKDTPRLSPPKGRFNHKWLPGYKCRLPVYHKKLGHGFSIAYYKRVRLKSFGHLIADLDNNNQV